MSELEVKILCSEFTHLFLIKEAEILGRSFNSHIHHILKQYFTGQILPPESLKSLYGLPHPIILKPETYFTIRLYHSLLKTMPTVEPLVLTQKIQTAINAYLRAVFQNQKNAYSASNTVAQEILRYLAQ